VDLTVHRGERVAVMGENGAGKSTLMKIFSGVYPSDGGAVELDGQAFTPGDPAAALRSGISTVYQDPAVFGHLSVQENLHVGRQPRTRWGSVDSARSERQSTALLKSLGLPVSLVGRRMDRLSLAEQQQVLIARAVADEAKVLILDEPTSILTDTEASVLFRMVDQLTAAGTAVLYITHRFDELHRVADRFVVLRDGRLVGETRKPDRERLLLMMGGGEGASALEEKVRAGEAHPTVDAPAPSTTAGPEVLAVHGLTVAGRFEDVNLTVHSGQVVGLYGLVGAGRSEVALTIFGALRPTAGTMTLVGAPYRPSDSADALRSGVAFLPEDRKIQGLFTHMSVAENLAASSLRSLTHGGIVARKAQRSLVARWCVQLKIKATSPGAPIISLSGGNQQKVLLARAVATAPRLLILDEPTRGIDVGTKTEIHRDIRELTAAGLAVLIISSELPELLALADVVHVLHEGRVTSTFAHNEADADQVLRAAMGVHQQ
jgi:ABC-type sugar transport system ATPase subunit